ncbi:hypothetical protein KO527_20590 [Pseudoalteromonas sp. C2R02]|uniref:aminopeptidase n=1 Tax=Pseudoalteromonas sp. C2R02 TaxID=2841565 RepID=UPI001C09C1A1|nr:hypothetical protein [Pseudoalteromonas sp. C2R02]MBU2971752.1 hypothetical protein [Pseudoalteromonas sp. C2R02]
MNEKMKKGASVLVNTCAEVKQGEQALIIVSPATMNVGLVVLDELKHKTNSIIFECMPEPKIHGEEPPETVAKNMMAADIVFCLTPMSLAHTKARKDATSAKTRYLSLPDYSLNVLKSPALHTDFTEIEPVCYELADKLDIATRVRVTNPAGTDITFSIEKRTANRCPGIVRKPGDLGSPPDAEVNIAPLEGFGEGIIAVDGSVPCPNIGVVDKPIFLTIEKSTVVKVNCENKEVEAEVNRLFEDAGPKSRIIGEFGIGLNPNAVLCGVMLEDEGCAGTIHFGIGSNATIGGTNDVAFHLDFILREPTVWIGQEKLLEDGSIRL